MINKKVDPIRVKWFNDAVTDSQKCQHQATQEKTGLDDPTTDAVCSTNIVEEIGYPITIKASDSDTVLEEKNVSPIKAQHSESINCISKLANSETKVTEINRYSNCSKKIPATRSSDFYGKIKC